MLLHDFLINREVLSGVHFDKTFKLFGKVMKLKINFSVCQHGLLARSSKISLNVTTKLFFSQLGNKMNFYGISLDIEINLKKKSLWIC